MASPKAIPRRARPARSRSSRPRGPALYGLIVAGGTGTRLWPVSRASHPKQLLDLGGGGRSLLQETFVRLKRSVEPRRILTVTGEGYRDSVLRQLRAVNPRHGGGNVLGEPVGRDSAPAILWGALRIAAERPGALMAVVWSDHLIRGGSAFDQGLATAVRAAGDGSLVAIGVTPAGPESGFGYIQAGRPAGQGAFAVRRFVEKPSRRLAERFIAQGGFTWNAGLFVFPVETLIEEYTRYAPELIGAFLRRGRRVPHNDWSDPKLIARIYGALGEGSIDSLVLEKTKRLKVVPCDLDWSDIGSWDAVYRRAPKDRQGNVIQGNALTLDTRNSLIRGGRRLIAAIGVENLIVIDTEDALLICDMNRGQDIKRLVALLKARGDPEAEQAATTYRPWGSFIVIERGEGYQVKLIDVLPRQQMSLQLHHRRDEHWIVVEGTASVVIGKETRTMRKNDHALIRRRQKHRIGNPTGRPLRILELQQGDYLGEDDIVRFEDRYGRV